MIERFTADWWDELRRMPLDEAEDMIRAVKTELLELTVGKAVQIHHAPKITRLNEELARISRVREASGWQKAMRRALTDEQIDAVRTAKRLLEIEAGGPR